MAEDIQQEVPEVESTDSQQQYQPSDAEVKAQRLGWVPKEQFKGDPEQWRDADSFLKRGEEIQGYLRADLEKLHATLSKRDQEIAEIRSVMEDFRKFHNETEARAYKKAIEDLKQLKVEAIEQGDGKKVIELEDQIEKIQEAQASNKPQTKPQNQQDEIKAYNEWLAENDWYIKDPELQELAEDYGEILKKKNPSLSGKEFLEKVTEKVKKSVPEKFQNPNRQVSSVGTSSDSRPSGNKGKKTYNDLPADAKKACDKFVKSIPGYTVADYLKDYDWEG